MEVRWQTEPGVMIRNVRYGSQHPEGAIESGRKDDRPELACAVALCRQQKARLLVVKLDRLARSVALTSNLVASGVDFLAVDMPEANKLTAHILAAVAEHEREMIGQRTRAALAAAKTRGTRLGNPQTRYGKGQSCCFRQCCPLPSRCNARDSCLADGPAVSAGIAAESNARGIGSARGRI